MILSSFGIPDYAKLSSYLPQGSIVIIDQVDFTAATFNETIRGNVIDLATDSHNSKKYLAILCVSDANLAKKVLDCNGGEKINLVVAPENLKWTEIDAEKFIRMKNIPEDKIQFHLGLFAPCYNPQIMQDYFKQKGWTDDAIRSRTAMKEERSRLSMEEYYGKEEGDSFNTFILQEEFKKHAAHANLEEVEKFLRTVDINNWKDARYGMTPLFKAQLTDKDVEIQQLKDQVVNMFSKMSFMKTEKYVSFESRPCS
eukprot:gene25923-34517_t